MMKQNSKEFKLLQKIQQPKKGKAATTSHGFGLIAADFYAHISAIYNLKLSKSTIWHSNGHPMKIQTNTFGKATVINVW